MRIALPELVLGGAGYAGLYRAVAPETATATLRAAWDGGVRAFDTAPHYGAGMSEERLGAFLAAHPRDEFVLSTKIGRLLYDDRDALDGTDGFFGTPARSRRRDYTGSGTRRSLEDSLQRLDLDRIDVALIHDPDDHQEQALAGAVPELTRMREEGTVTGIGVGVNDADLALRFVRECDLDCVLIAGRYTLLDSRASGLLDECLRRDIEVMVAGVFNSGLLADPTERDTFDYRSAAPEIVARARKMADACAEYGVSIRAAALQFPLRHPAVGSLVSGAATAAEVHDTIAQLAITIPDELWKRLDEVAA
ncbi:aldo/keto reductase [Gordonia rhizosphera]|uniref:Putative aldo/keto reductase n=1 Tax=Gordonia rhizosphera NBRC 16068 TaxID=1108045 RepID=K6VAG1_9ACTN|nr:aldo/keto reductase [Gordonia rhizosphera]GAB93193.1 putative aldo/keto reductase [Gordonia rhizosphera NBRC 16068]